MPSVCSGGISRSSRRGGPPQLHFHNAAGEHFRRLGASKAMLTITHTDALALAHVILVGESSNAR